MHPRSLGTIKEVIRSSGIEEIHQNPVAIGCPHQRRDPARHSLSPTRLTLHPGDGSALGHRRSGDHTPSAPQAATAEDLLGGGGAEAVNCLEDWRVEGQQHTPNARTSQKPVGTERKNP